MAHVTMRPAELQDAPAIVALIESAYRGEGSRAGWTTEADLLDGQRTDCEEVAELVASPHSRLFLAERDGELIGCCHLERISDSTGYFGMLSVRPGVQTRGVGSALVDEAERVARDEWGLPTMHIHVVKQRDELIAWYERRGYTRTGTMLPFPYGNERFGIPKRPDLEFAELAKALL